MEKMKKMLQITALFVAACYFLVGCDESDPTPSAEKVSLSVEANSLSVVQGSDVSIIVKASKAVETSLVVNVVSDNAAVTVPATLTIEAGKDQVTGTAKGVSVGTSKITITANDVDYSVQNVSITVTEKMVDTPELSFAEEAGNIAPGGTSEFTITSTVAPKADLTINLSSNKPAVATVPASVVLGAGKTSVTVTVSGVAVGDAVVSMTADGASISGTLAIKVAEADKYGNLYATGALNPPGTPFTNLVCESNVFGKVYPGSLYYHDYDKQGGTSTGIYKSTIDYYGGDAVGTLVDGEVFFTSIPEGTVIDNKLSWQYYKTTYMRFPIVVKNGDVANSIADGTHYIVLALPREGDPNNTGWENAVNMPCWMKIKVTGMKIEVLDGAMLLDDKHAFKVGQK